MPHPSANHLISRVRDFIRWQEKMFGDPSARGAPFEDPIGWVTDIRRRDLPDYRPRICRSNLRSTRTPTATHNHFQKRLIDRD
jgi:hypothetical protein